MFGESGLRVRWADPAFEAIQAHEPRWVPDAVHPYLDVDAEEDEGEGEEMDLDVHIELQVPPDGAGYTVAFLGAPHAGLPVVAPEPRGLSAMEGLSLEGPVPGPSALEGIPVEDESEERESVDVMDS